MVPVDVVQTGMDRFNFLLETCVPGTVPDPLLIAALLDLPKAPVVTRACYLLECAYFVHQCNRGQWPNWLKSQLPSASRQSRSLAGQLSSMSGGTIAGGSGVLNQHLIKQKRAVAMQLQAGKMFHQWAQVWRGEKKS